MAVALQGQAKVRRVGNGLCLPLPTRELRAERIREGDEVFYVVSKPTPMDPKAFGALRRYFPKGKSIQELLDEDRVPGD